MSNETREPQKENLIKDPSYQAYQILRFAFTVVPILTGLDKFFNVSTQWAQYLSNPFNIVGSPQTTLMLIGAIEIVAGIGVWLKPKLFANIVVLWLMAIMLNIFLLHNFYEVILSDLGLLLGALALARLSVKYDHS